MAEKQTRKQQQEKAREQRLAAQQAAAARESRMRRLQIVVGTVLAAAVIVGLGFVFLSGQDTAERNVGGDVSTSESGVRGVTETNRLFRGVPQDGYTLGREDAPVTLYSYVDFQCPFCAEHELQATPAVVDQLVRPGRVKIVTLPLNNISEDSARAAGVANTLAKKNRFYEFAHLFFFNQGPEGTGYADDAFLRRIVAEVPGAGPSDVTPDLTTELRDVLEDHDRQFTQGGGTGTPFFQVARSGSDQRETFEASNDVFARELSTKVDELTR